MRSTTNHLFFALLLLGALGSRTAPAAAGEADLGPYFERTRAAAPAATYRASQTVHDRLMPDVASLGYCADGEILAINGGAGVAQRADGARYFTVLFVR